MAPVPEMTPTVETDDPQKQLVVDGIRRTVLDAAAEDRTLLRRGEQREYFPASVSVLPAGWGEFQMQVGDTWWRVRLTRVRD